MKHENDENGPRCSFSEDERLRVIKALGYYRMRIQDRNTPLLDWEVEDLVETLEVIEGSLLKVWPILAAIAGQPLLDIGEPEE